LRNIRPDAIEEFTLAILAVQGRDIKLGEDRLELSNNFTNKLFNASNYLLLNRESFKDLDETDIKTPLGKYILSRFNIAVSEIRDFLEQYRFNDGATTLYRFLKREFCDWGIELSKSSKESIDELGAIFKEAMRLLHPYMPFISEHLYQRLSKSSLENSESIMISPYPNAGEVNQTIISDFEIIIEAIVSIRRCKVLVDKANQRVPKVYIKFNKDKDVNQELAEKFIKKVANVDEVSFVDAKPKNSVVDVSDNLESFISTEDIDIKPIKNRLEKQKIKLQNKIDKLKSVLNNEKFILNAPENVVKQNQKALEDTENKLKKVENELKRFNL